MAGKQRPPLILFEKKIARLIGRLSSKVREIEHPLGNHHIKRQAGLQIAGIRQAANSIRVPLLSVR